MGNKEIFSIVSTDPESAKTIAIWHPDQGVFLLALPHEILLQIIEDFDPDNKEDLATLGNLRLTGNPLLNDIATSIIFAEVRVPDDYNKLPRASGILTSPWIASHIHTLVIDWESLLPGGRDGWNHDSFVAKVEENIAQYKNGFTLHVSKILQASAQGLQTIKVSTGSIIAPERPRTSADTKVETAFFTGLLEMLSSVRLPSLDRFEICYSDIENLSFLWEAYWNSSKGSRLAANLEGLCQFFIERSTYFEGETSTTHLKDLLALLPSLDLSSLSFDLFEYEPMTPQTLAPLAHNRSLTSLDLERISIIDNLARIIESLTSLTSISLDYVELSPAHKWQDVFLVILDKMESYNNMAVKLATLRYQDSEPCMYDADLCCSGRPEDLSAALKLRERIITTATPPGRPSNEFEICEGCDDVESMDTDSDSDSD